MAPRVLRRDELATARERLPGQLGLGARPDPLRRRRRPSRVSPDEQGDPALEACELWEAALDAIGEPLPGGRGGAALAAPERAAAGRAAAGPRRLPARQPDRRRAGARRGDRLGALPRRRPGRGPRLAVHPLVAVRQRRAAGRRARGAGRVPRRLRGRGRGAPRPRALALVVGDGQRQVGGDLRPPGPRPPDRRAPVRRARVAGTADLRARMGPARTLTSPDGSGREAEQPAGGIP